MDFKKFDTPEYEHKRRKLVEILKDEGIKSQKVLNAILKIPRHMFVPQEYLSLSYENEALPIGYGQTISQPYIVALMTEALNLQGNEKVLEIGTGSGYQTAILAELALEIYTVERIKELLEEAKKRLRVLGYNNVYFKLGDGTLGWEEFAPYDRIIVTAASYDIPEPLKEQLKDGGIMVIPIGGRDFQYLYRITKKGDNFYRENLGGVRFVPLKGEYGWKD
ncbi:protein-L-isoaspartate(D-aspartate) O-methyltransferase [Dictyoglomus thermophilum]|uniref:Protein-L-isoaspartate O-methyltransferase n=1 Tax=Dictyoglomus thermophilum (strain ATCC 35947 / DSM 3960 / H-6-12) TaxID=309799 RepID=PIMT_DICT6|nr:protein-L-isoaspartate(D-aspartate) O-methyltransferase [Dictyoglomus thermophilum]B5YF00.1 RecName: Full=Protein-L-isoaspartate O-methyltransferase; AltName: Full=L-isoaspartyl protein carboxyl methyltransferase; AltName: Full=Protein L-isoaspartyl methyltransferase; AltName: Full=Protein-beta-aspartate methyltransferase; Short=PIMT [Dictyoglomus thermophilum H-6-12]ACI19465.1 protein-L-isoaspartate O-methyltransferase [Dictyoglomus thermophilum H-6-12]